MTGTIERLRKEKSHGWILPDDGGELLFFHASTMAGGSRFDHVRSKSRVEFELESVRGGQRAIDVRLVS